MIQTSLIRYVLATAALVFCMGHAARTEAARNPASARRVSIRYPVSSPYYPIVLTGARLPALLGEPIRRISLYTFHNAAWRPIPFQIDRRDTQGRYRLPVTKADQESESGLPFDGNDECVFMAADLGEKGDRSPEGSGLSPGMEIEITDPGTGQQGWVYAVMSDRIPPERTEEDYISYSREKDAIESDTYRIGFSKDEPFLVDTLNWKRPDTGAYTPDLVDTMKVRHTGRLWQTVPFLRTQDDTRSRVLSVKDGPVRVIRRIFRGSSETGGFSRPVGRHSGTPSAT